MNPVDPLAGYIGECREVLSAPSASDLEAAHLTGRCRPNRSTVEQRETMPELTPADMVGAEFCEEHPLR